MLLHSGPVLLSEPRTNIFFTSLSIRVNSIHDSFSYLKLNLSKKFVKTGISKPSASYSLQCFERSPCKFLATLTFKITFKISCLKNNFLILFCLKRVGLRKGKKLRKLGFHKITFFYCAFEEYLSKLNVALSILTKYCQKSFWNKTVSWHGRIPVLYHIIFFWNIH